MSQPPVELILASASPRRQELMSVLGLPFRVQASDVDETVASGIPPAAVVEELAIRKARAVADSLEQGIVIGSDTVVVLRDQILGKPTDADDAFRMLQALQGQTHDVYTGLACIHAGTSEVVSGFRRTSVRFKRLTPEVIRRYIATGEPMDKAGAYAIQGLGCTFVEGMDGDYFSVVGLPLCLLSEQLQQFHIEVL